MRGLPGSVMFRWLCGVGDEKAVGAGGRGWAGGPSVSSRWDHAMNSFRVDLRQRWPRLTVSIGAFALLVSLSVVSPVSAYVYWSNAYCGANCTPTTLGRSNLDGSGQVEDFVKGADDPIGVAVDAEHVYWANSGTKSIGRANHDGSAPTSNFVRLGSDKRSIPDGVAVGGGHIYWTDEGTQSIGRANLDGSDPNPSFITGASDPSGIALDGNHIYWANAFGNDIGRANLDGTGVNEAFINDAGVPSGVDGVAVDADHIYWSEYIAGEIGRANLNGSGINHDFIKNAGEPGMIAVDGQHIYWADPIDNQIRRANLDGSSVVPNFAAASGPSGVAVDLPKDVTTTAVSCTPATLMLASSTSCTTTVTDHAADPQAPAGPATFRATKSGSFAPSNGCSLQPLGPSQSSCKLTFHPGEIGLLTISAAYPGDLIHGASAGTASLRVLARKTMTKLTISSLGETNSKFAVASASTPLSGRTAGMHTVRGTVFSFKLDQSATVKIAILQTHVGGRRVGHRCLPPTPRRRHDPGCFRTVTVATLTRSAHKGRNRVRFTGRISGRALSLGRYRARFIATDAAGASTPRSLRFTIVR